MRKKGPGLFEQAGPLFAFQFKESVMGVSKVEV